MSRYPKYPGPKTPRAPRVLPPPAKLGAEPSWDDPAGLSPQAQEQLGSLVYLAGATEGVGNGNAATGKFVNSLNNSVYSEYMNQALGL